MKTFFEALDKLNIYLGKWFNVPVYLHWSWILMMILLLLWSPMFAATLVGVFFIVLLHECGHCIAAHRYNVPVNNITLLPLGGVASMRIPWEPIPELVVAVAGPAVNLLLILPLWLLSHVGSYFETLFLCNIVLFVFNMIPAFPMDGGRVMRSLISHFSGNHLKATTIAARTGQGFAILFGILGIIVGNLMLVVIAIFIFFAAEQELQQAKTRFFVDETIGYLNRVKGTPEEPEGAEESLELLRRFQRKMGVIDRTYRDGKDG